MIRKRLHAQRDLIRHFAYLYERSPEAAERFLEAAEDAFRRLEKMPELGHLWHFAPPQLADVRVWPLVPKFGRYLVFYRPEKNGVEILHVFHSAQNISEILEDEDSDDLN